MKVLIRSNWGPFIGTDYVEALGIYDSLEQAREDAEVYAMDKWEPDEEDSGIEDEGPDVVVEEYNPLTHDDERAGGGSFADDFARMTN
jgi:hypothetical protein